LASALLGTFLGLGAYLTGFSAVLVNFSGG
jgi:hypothetical protein